MIENGALVDVKSDLGESPLIIAAMNGTWNIDVWDLKSIWWFDIVAGKDIIADILIEHGADVNSTNYVGSTALHFAVDNTTVDLLIKAGANVNALDRDKWSPLHFAAQSGNSSFLFVLNSFCPWNYSEIYSLCDSQYSAGSEKIADLLIKNGAIVDSQSDEGDSPLIIAANNGSFWI